ncbi:MAG TPA: ABC transporter permease [Gammaproteobacteria bacterium]|nr:ABC transporter permease [Gammaproteobacteria bacterium]
MRLKNLCNTITSKNSLVQFDAMKPLIILIVSLGVGAALTVSHIAAAAQSKVSSEDPNCLNLHLGYGPFNYNTARGRAHWKIVEEYHFTPSVQRLQHGHTASIPQDLDYTLRAFPNQPLALYDMAKYQLAHGYPLGGTYNSVHYVRAECYFKRAIRFAPKDGVVRMLYGIYLQRKGDHKAALKRYKQAEKLINPKRAAELHYDMGLLYLKMKDYAKAREQAKRAYSEGYPLPGLRKQLQAVGEW